MCFGRFAGCDGAVPLQAELQPAARRRPAFDAADYKGRNVIERGFNVVKPRRGLATRYDNLAIVYRGAAVLRTITIVARDVRFSDGGVDMNGHSDWFGTSGGHYPPKPESIVPMMVPPSIVPATW